jgi:hypothetical protein
MRFLLEMPHNSLPFAPLKRELRDSLNYETGNT